MRTGRHFSRGIRGRQNHPHARATAVPTADLQRAAETEDAFAHAGKTEARMRCAHVHADAIVPDEQPKGVSVLPSGEDQPQPLGVRMLRDIVQALLDDALLEKGGCVDGRNGQGYS
mgnify:CR=1 FL=1